jgi:multidrug efflux pump
MTAARRRLSMVGFLVVVLLMAFLFARMPTGFLPDEDQGLLFGQTVLPPGSTAEQTAALNAKVSDYILKT